MPLKNSRTGWPSVSPVTYSTPLMIRLLRFFRAALSSVHSGLNPDITAVRLVVSILSSARDRLMVLNNVPPNATVKPTIKPSLYLKATSPRDDRQSWREPDFRYVSVRKFYHTIVRTHDIDGGRIFDTRPPCRRGAASDCSSTRAIGCPPRAAGSMPNTRGCFRCRPQRGTVGRSGLRLGAKKPRSDQHRE